LRAFSQIVPLHAIERVVLRVMVFFIVGHFLDAPGRGYACAVEGHVVAAAFVPQAGFGKTDGFFFCERIKNTVQRFARGVIVHQTDGKNFSGARVVHEDAGDFGHFILMRGNVGT